MKGYFQRQDLTDAVISQGWFMTGDIGLINDQGQLFLKGRERDEINKGGMKIYPADVDEVFEQSGTTQDICTFRLKDELYGENVGIALVLKDRGEDAIRNLHHWIDTHLAQHKQPVRWYVLDDIPRTSNGKINRETVRHACTSRTPLNLQQILRNANSG